MTLPWQIVWIILIPTGIIFDCITCAITGIWVSIAAGIALVINISGSPIDYQLLGFIILFVILLRFIRPFCVKYINKFYIVKKYPLAEVKNENSIDRTENNRR